MSGIPDPDTTIGSFFGLAADGTYDLATIETDLAALTDHYAADIGTLDGIVGNLWTYGLPQGAYAVSAGGVVSVLRAPLPPVVLVPQGPAIVALLCALVSTALVALGEPSEGAIVTALNLRASQGPALQAGNNPYPG
ncbi:MAG TPA: hypothetical protein VN886_05515 [Acidimicrobiales bacterium]|nr:hypothetical protein [Acidimicrobiales bacterium]